VLSLEGERIAMAEKEAFGRRTEKDGMVGTGEKGWAARES